MSDAINPYQPPSASLDVGDGPINEFSFRLTKRNLNHGHSHHQIRCRPYGVAIVSILSIIISLACFVWAIEYFGRSQAIFVMPFLMGASALAYVAVIFKPKQLTRQRMNECGLVAGAAVTIHIQPDEMIAQTDEHTNRWQRDDIKCYRTPRGLMIVPEQFMFFFLPKHGQFDRPTYKAIAKEFLRKKSR